MAVAGDDAVRVEGTELRLAAPAGRVPALARALVAADVDITALYSVERSLEEVFFDLTTRHEEVPA
jgi:ABC-2 type transport system ATP-binding protein